MKIMMMFYLIIFCCSCFAGVPRSRIIQKINPQKLHLLDVMKEGGGRFSVIDSDCVIISEKNELLIIKNDSIIRRIKCPGEIAFFDINPHGNGIIVNDSILYCMRNFQVIATVFKPFVAEINNDFIESVTMINLAVPILCNVTLCCPENQFFFLPLSHHISTTGAQ
jgi:hypothetical protein